MFDLELQWDRPARTGAPTTSHTLRARIVPRASSGPFAAGLPVRMAIALDISGSMAGDKLVLAKQACERVIARLRPQDRLSLSGFSTELLTIVEDMPGGRESVQIASRALARIRAVGVTRADVALQWLEKVLPPSPGAMRVGILITDGHPTDPMGGRDVDPRPLLDMAARMGRAGITVCAVGLGAAASFNTALLTRISDRGRGAFLHAETSAGLEQVLTSRLSDSQAMAIADAALEVELLSPAVELRAACRFRPEYLPLEVEQSAAFFRVGIGPVRADAVTDSLFDLSIPAPSTAADGPRALGQRAVARVRLVGDGGVPLSEGTASITDSASYTDAQRRDEQVEQDRLSWEVNRYSDALLRAQSETGEMGNPRRTGQLLVGMQQSALRVGNEQLASDIASQISHLRQTGRLDAERATGLLTASRNLGAAAGDRATGVLPMVSDNQENAPS